MIPSTLPVRSDRGAYGAAAGSTFLDTVRADTASAWHEGVDLVGAGYQDVLDAAQVAGQIPGEIHQLVVDKKHSTTNYVADKKAQVGADWAKLKGDMEKLLIGTALVGVAVMTLGGKRLVKHQKSRRRIQRRLQNPAAQPVTAKEEKRVTAARAIGAATGIWLISPFSPEDIVLPVIGTLGGIAAGAFLVAASLLLPEADLVGLIRKIS